MSDRKATSLRKSRARELEQVEMRPDGWERFLLAVGAAAKSGPKHRPKKKKKTRRK